MKIKVTGEYKSLRDFESEKLPDFTVITGKNGSGKTQLLELLKDANNPKQDKIELIPKQEKLIQFEGIESANLSNFNKGTWDTYVERLRDKWFHLPEQDRLLLSSAIDLGFSFDELFDKEKFKTIYLNLNEDTLMENEDGYLWQTQSGQRIQYSDIQKLYDVLIGGGYINNIHRKTFNLVQEISTYFFLKAEDIKPHHFSRTPIKSIYIDNNSLFNSDFLPYVMYMHETAI